MVGPCTPAWMDCNCLGMFGTLAKDHDVHSQAMIQLANVMRVDGMSNDVLLLLLHLPYRRRESFQVMFIPGSLAPWTDPKGVAVAWTEGPPAFDGDRGWLIARSPATDADGWMYGTSFERLQYDRPGGRASKRVSDSIRSRLWRRAGNEAAPGAAHHKQQQVTNDRALQAKQMHTSLALGGAFGSV